MTRACMVAPLLTGLVLLAATGCGGGGDDGDTTAANPSPSAASSSSPTGGSTSSEAPSSTVGSTAPSVVPADGRTISTYSMTFAVPKGFKASGGAGNGLASSVQVESPKSGCFVIAGGIGNLDSATFEESAARSLDSGGGKRQPDREVGGQQVYVITKSDQITSDYMIGRPAGDQVADLSIFCAKITDLAPTPAERDALIESILATVVWKA